MFCVSSRGRHERRLEQGTGRESSSGSVLAQKKSCSDDTSPKRPGKVIRLDQTKIPAFGAVRNVSLKKGVRALIVAHRNALAAINGLPERLEPGRRSF